MLDPLIVIVAVGAASGMGAFGAGAMALKAHTEIVKAKRDPLAEALDQAYPLDPAIPEELLRLLDRMDGRA